ncbi:response regulator [Pseudomonas fluorescens]|uniref:response regulator n=1 Tax=Pseudomonas fluorescens TaxID=294 RepID=UPI0005DC8BF9|nr:response regulator [Pseudomonas fluorescens]KJH88158.1 response regulator [Pseudomonas fluorescens]
MNVDWEGMLPIEGAVIIVEDDPTLRSLMTSILVEVGAETLAFDTADDALTFLLQSHERCPLVIADQGLPGQIQGIEFIEMIQSRWPTTAAILTSGYLINPLDLPASAIYLHKPWSLDELVTSVAAALQPGNPLYKR